MFTSLGLPSDVQLQCKLQGNFTQQEWKTHQKVDMLTSIDSRES